MVGGEVEVIGWCGRQCKVFVASYVCWVLDGEEFGGKEMGDFW